MGFTARGKVGTEHGKPYLRAVKPDLFSIVYGPTKVVP
jgi:hypothetical protein